MVRACRSANYARDTFRNNEVNPVVYSLRQAKMALGRNFSDHEILISNAVPIKIFEWLTVSTEIGLSKEFRLPWMESPKLLMCR